MNNIPLLAGLISPRDIRIEDKYDKILKAYLDGKVDDLPEDLKGALERWSQVNSMLRQGEKVGKGKNKYYKPYKYDQVVKFIVAQFGVSIRTAYDDIKSAKRFFAIQETKVDDDFAKGIFIEKLEEAFAVCLGTGDHKSATAYAKVIASIRKWDKEQDDEAPKYAELELPHFALVADPSELGFPKMDNPDAAVKRILEKRKKGKIDNILATAETIEILSNNGGEKNMA